MNLRLDFGQYFVSTTQAHQSSRFLINADSHDDFFLAVALQQHRSSLVTRLLGITSPASFVEANRTSPPPLPHLCFLFSL